MSNSAIVLHPGELYFGKAPGTIKTILGSCVAVIVWHPKLLVGGINHYLMATPKKENMNEDEALRYGSFSLTVMEKKMLSIAPITEYQVSLFGGSNMFPQQNEEVVTIGQANIICARHWLNKHKLLPQLESIGGDNSRTISFDLTTGLITLKKYEALYKDDK